VAVVKMMAPYGGMGKFESFPVIATEQMSEVLAAK
jgi:hypothetical protein